VETNYTTSVFYGHGMTQQSDNPVRNRIIQKSTEIFLSQGFAKISMDEIARSLGMSKKTIYKYFSAKEDLVKTVMVIFRDETLSIIESTANDEELDENDRLMKIFEVTAEKLSRIQKPILEDMEKYLPDFWMEFDTKRRMMIREIYGKIIAGGKKEGIIRQDVDEEFFILIFGSLVSSIANPQVMPHIPYSLSQVYKNIIKTLFTGILTDEARKNYHNKYFT
jgi:TetR/AcrR family transcriptional regulator, transcriptional repressor of aconitase